MDRWTKKKKEKESSHAGQLDGPPWSLMELDPEMIPEVLSVLVGHFQRSGLFELSLNLGANGFFGGGRKIGGSRYTLKAHDGNNGLGDGGLNVGRRDDIDSIA